MQMLYILVLLSVGYIATDIYLPSLPALVEYFKATENEVQMTLFSYMVSFAVVPLFFGPLSDHFGRKKIILLGIVIAFGATLGCLFSTDIYSMIFYRFLQGIGTGAIFISARAMLVDCFSGNELAKMISYITMFIPLILAVAPTIGGILQEQFNWQSIFVFFALFISGLFCWVLSRPESLKMQTDKKLSQIVKNYKIHLVNKVFIYQILFVFPTVAMYAYFATSPFLFQEGLGLSPREYGAISLLIGAVIIACSTLNTRLIYYYSKETLMMIGSGLILVSGCLLLLFQAFGVITSWSLIIPILIFFACVPFCVANSNAKALMAIKNHFGAASALLSTLQFLAGALGTFVFSNIDDSTPLPLAICLVLMGALCLLHVLFAPTKECIEQVE